MIEWISVEERLPKIKQWVLIATKRNDGKGIYDACFNGEKWIVNSPANFCSLNLNEQVTHWAEINEPENKTNPHSLKNPPSI